ncbi:MAG: zinc-finger domain-containing protein [Bacillus sp. (in: firmicutes)]
MNGKKQRTQLLQQIETTLTEYCEGCFLHSHHRKEFSRTYAHQYCLSSCIIGERLKQYGEKLNCAAER